MEGFHYAEGDLDGIISLCVGHLPLPGLATLAACCRAGYALATGRALAVMPLEYHSMQHRDDKVLGSCSEAALRHASPLTRWSKLRAGLRPRSCCRGYRLNWQDKTIPLKFVFDSKGPIFVEYQMTVANAPNGTPSIGLVDANAQLSQDISAFVAVAFGPVSGHMFATIDRRGPLRLRNFDALVPAEGPVMECARARLPWKRICDEGDKWNAPVRTGFFVENGELSFYRGLPCGCCWQSSGVVCENLPPVVLPCVFLRSFMGFTNTRFIRVWDSPPLMTDDRSTHYDQTEWAPGRW